VRTYGFRASTEYVHSAKKLVYSRRLGILWFIHGILHSLNSDLNRPVRQPGTAVPSEILPGRTGMVKAPLSAILTVRHRPAPKRRRCFCLALGWTVLRRPVSVLCQDGRTGRLRTLSLNRLVTSRSNIFREWTQHLFPFFGSVSKFYNFPVSS
jgi:hypothetical protein